MQVIVSACLVMVKCQFGIVSRNAMRSHERVEQERSAHNWRHKWLLIWTKMQDEDQVTVCWLKAESESESWCKCRPVEQQLHICLISHISQRRTAPCCPTRKSLCTGKIFSASWKERSRKESESCIYQSPQNIRLRLKISELLYRATSNLSKDFPSVNITFHERHLVTVSYGV